MNTINRENYREVLENIAEQYDLEVVNTTDKGNGYPSNIMPMLIGFKDFEQFKTISNEYQQLNHFALDKKDGWQLYYRKSDWFTDCFEIELDNDEYEYACSYYYDTHTYAMALGVSCLSDLEH